MIEHTVGILNEILKNFGDIGIYIRKSDGLYLLASVNVGEIVEDDNRPIVILETDDGTLVQKSELIN